MQTKSLTISVYGRNRDGHFYPIQDESVRVVVMGAGEGKNEASEGRKDRLRVEATSGRNQNL